MRPDTALVSIMMVNNEIGVVQPMKEIGEMCRSRKIFFHTDAAQAVGKMDVDVNDMKIDLLSISGHKIYGPKGWSADSYIFVKGPQPYSVILCMN